MEPKNRHPLECITNQGGLSMLEALIPFVEYPMKLPLALFIKFNEIKLIINAFRSIDNLTRLGLNAASGSPTDMLCALTGISPDILKMMMSLSESTNGSGLSPEMLSGLSGQSEMDFSSLATILGQLGAQDSFQKPSNSDSHSFDDALQRILSEYDMAQAEAYRSNPSDTNEAETSTNSFLTEEQNG